MKSVQSVLRNSVFSISVGLNVHLWLPWMQAENKGGGCEQGSSSATLTPRGAPNQKKRVSPALLQGLDQPANVWVAREP